VWPLVGAGVFGAAVLPMLGLVAFDFQYFSTVADHYVYVAMLGPALVLGWAVARWRGRVVKVCVALGLVALGVRSHVRAYDWRDAERLYAATLKVNPRSVMVNMNLASKYTIRANFANTQAAAQALYDKALGHYYQVLGVGATDYDIHMHMAWIYEREEHFEEAAKHYRAAFDGHPEAQAIQHYYVGTMLMKAGRLEEAEGEFRQALEIAKEDDPACQVAKECLAEVDRLRREAEGKATAPAALGTSSQPASGQ
jgi:tetratricopeptide (TPR) repeat protein